MRGAKVKEFNRQANGVARETVDAIAPAIEACLKNCEILKGRLETLEVIEADRQKRGLFGRLKWLLRGR